VVALVWGRVRPAGADQESDRITIAVKVRRSAKDELSIESRGRAGELDRMAAELAAGVAASIGRAVAPETRALLESCAGHPFAVHRFLGRAERRLEAGDHVQATLMFDRAGSFAKRGAIPEAIAGRHRAEGARVAEGAAEFGSRAELASAAAEKASVALRDRDEDGARRALIDVLRYTSVRALRWSAEIHLGGEDRAVVVGRDKRWLAQSDVGPDGLWSLHPPTGAVLSVSAGKKGLVSAIGSDLLTLNGRILSRQPLSGALVWKVALPLEPSGDLWERALLSQGSLGVRSERGVAWVEVGLGALGQVATDAVPVAQSPSGILVRADGGVGLLRPGKKTPAWRVEGAFEDAALTTDRVVLIAGEELQILQILDGKPAKTLAAPKNGRILRAHGRYACIAAEDGLHLYDVLSGEKTAVLSGPGRAIDCHSESTGVAVLHAGGDLLFFDRDGKLLDRARAPGRPERLLRGSPIAPGPVAVTDRGLFAFAEIGSERMLRDVDAMMKLAELESARGDRAAALRLLDWVALGSAGRVAQAEKMRASILRVMKQERAARRAEQRAAAAADPSVALPAFSIE
jgi:hypothetical protein